MTYWQKRVQLQQDRLFNSLLLDFDKVIAKEYVRCLNEVKTQLSSLYDEILESAADGTLLVSDLYKYNRYYELINSLNSQLTRLGYKEIKITEMNLQTMYQKNCSVISQTMNFNPYVDENAMKRCVEGVWCADGKHWSNRIWENKSALQAQIEKGIIDCIARGVSKSELVKEISSTFTSGFKNADRLARTELAYVQNQSTKDKFIEAGLTQYEFYCAQDERTCIQCKRLHTKVFNIKDAIVGKNFPPIHPNDRCTILGVIDQKEG